MGHYSLTRIEESVLVRLSLESLLRVFDEVTYAKCITECIVDWQAGCRYRRIRIISPRKGIPMGYGKPWKLETYKNILYCTGNVIRCIVANIMDYTQPYKD